MDELNNGEQGQYVEPGKNEKKNNTRKIDGNAMKSFALKKSYGMPIYYNKVFIYL